MIPPGVEAGAWVLVRRAAHEDLVGDLEQAVRDRGDRLLLRGRVLVSAEAADQPVVPRLQPAPDRIAAQAAWTSIGLI